MERSGPSGRVLNRKGSSLYVLVIGVTMIVSTLGLSAMLVARMHLRQTRDSGERREVAMLGASAIENGLVVLSQNPNWRQDLQSGAEYPSPPVSLGNGTFTWRVVDDDGDLADNAADTVILQGIGRVGSKTHIEQVRLEPIGAGLTCLEASLHCQGDISTSYTASITTNQRVSSNNSIDASGTNESIEGNAEAVGSITGTITGTSTNGIVARQMPSSHAFDYYVNMGTQIDVSQLPSFFGYSLMQQVVLGPQNNPFGSANPQGIYVLDCNGAKVAIQNLRVIGTLVILDPAPGSLIDGQINMEPVVVNHPSLLVRGDIDFVYKSDWPVTESLLGVNFNPVGAPYQGNEDSDLDDSYPCIIKGLVYVSGKLNLSFDFAYSKVDGVVVCNAIAPNSDFQLTYRSVFLDHPPPGFAAGSAVRVIPGSWARVPTN